MKLYFQKLLNYQIRLTRAVPRIALASGWLMLGSAAAYGQTSSTNAGSPPNAAEPGVSGGGEGQQLGDVVINGPSNITPAALAANELQQVAGGTGVVDTSQLKIGRVANVADALRFQPGVLAKSVNGGEATRLSLRGSGIIRPGFLFGFGNQLEIDGLRVYSASGNPYEEIEVLATDHIEVLRGSNGFDDGPLSLGGVINYVTKTGYNAAPLEVRFEAGSYGYFHEQVSSGLVAGPVDYYVSLTRFDLGGYRDNTHSNSSRAVFNIGYQIVPNLTTRVEVIYAQQKQEDAGYLTWAQLEENPRQSQFPQVRSRQNPGSLLISDKTRWQITPDSSLEAGLQYNNYPINSAGGPAPNRFIFDDLSSLLRYQRRDVAFGDHEVNTRISFQSHTQLTAKFDTFDGSANYESRDAYTGRRPSDQADYSLVFSNDFEIIKQLWITTGAALNYQTRETRIDFSSAPTPLTGTQVDRQYFYAEPRLGLRYEVDPSIQFFANVTRSVDTPSSNSYIRTNPNLVPLGTLDLRAAQAYTAEVGARGEKGIFRWSIDYYHSWIDNELLTTPIVPGSPATITANATSTHHEGIEVALDTTLWQAREAAAPAPKDGKDGKASAPEAAAPPHRLVLRQAYTWSHFYFDSDPVFGSNQLPGVPEHLYQAELDYEHPSGFYAGVNVESVFNRYPIDFADSVYAHPYAILGARAGYNAPENSPFKGLSLFVELRNLTDENYAPVVVTTYDAKGLDAPVYSPAPGRSVYGGISYRF